MYTHIYIHIIVSLDFYVSLSLYVSISPCTSIYLHISTFLIYAVPWHGPPALKRSARHTTLHSKSYPPGRRTPCDRLKIRCRVWFRVLGFGLILPNISDLGLGILTKYSSCRYCKNLPSPQTNFRAPGTPALPRRFESHQRQGSWRIISRGQSLGGYIHTYICTNIHTRMYKCMRPCKCI